MHVLNHGNTKVADCTNCHEELLINNDANYQIVLANTVINQILIYLHCIIAGHSAQLFNRH